MILTMASGERMSGVSKFLMMSKLRLIADGKGFSQPQLGALTERKPLDGHQPINKTTRELFLNLLRSQLQQASSSWVLAHQLL